MGFYYYKDGEKIGPVDPVEFYNLLEWGGDIKPDTIIELDNGKQLPASEHTPPPGSNPLNISLETARRLAVLCDYVKLFVLLGMAVSCIAMFAAGYAENNFLLKCFFIVTLVMGGLLLWVGYYQTKKLGKVPPKPKAD